jgi:hypothetical protein
MTVPRGNGSSILAIFISDVPIKKNQAGIAPGPTYTARGVHPTGSHRGFMS